MTLKSKFLTGLLLLLSAPWLAVSSHASDYQIIITTPGYTNIYRYMPDEFAEQLASDLKIPEASVSQEKITDDRSRVTLRIGQKEYAFLITPESPVVRLQYDRNRRQFTGVGFNYIEQTGMKYEAPNFKGTSIIKLPELWQPQIEKLIADRNLLDADQPNLFILEADIDEEGNVHKIVELNGALKQYSQVFIDKIYDMAVRGWQPARRNGVPFRTVAQICFELHK